MGHEENLGNDGYVHFPEHDDISMGIYALSKYMKLYILSMYSLLCASYTSIKLLKCEWRYNIHQIFVKQTNKKKQHNNSQT